MKIDVRHEGSVSGRRVSREGACRFCVLSRMFVFIGPHACSFCFLVENSSLSLEFWCSTQFPGLFFHPMREPMRIVLLLVDKEEKGSRE
mmetsp:Transcript_10537/g.18109  ORF Transcript_10537/g.18109 Transcript_10537/m.18109 type:complete len:89 (+) Transcript_10537:1469-1735(+)